MHVIGDRTPDGSRIELVSASGLVIEASTSADDGLLDEFYAAYDRAFVLANEKEGLNGFKQCLALNSGEAYMALTARFGPFREFVLVARDPGAADAIGGANLIACLLAPAGGTPILSVNLNYVFTNVSARRRGYFRRLIADLPLLVVGLFAKTNASDLPSGSATESGSPPVLIFFEQNDPYRMSRAEYELDTHHSGVDQLTRIRIWAGLGARIVDFSYVQPPLTPAQGADHTLACGVIGTQEDAISACLLHDHLERFFAISVLKGRDPATEPVAARQLEVLTELCGRRQLVALLASDSIRDATGPPWDSAAGGGSLRDVLRARAVET